MSRSKHTDPKTIRAARRVLAASKGRGEGDLSRRRELGRVLKQIGAVVGEEEDGHGGAFRPRITVRQPRAGFHHPADKQDVLKMMELVGPVTFYGLRSVELARASASGPNWVPVFGRYCVPGRILLFEQPIPPWRLSGLLKGDVARRLKRAGAVLSSLVEVGATLVDWPQDTLRRFMLEEVLLHELGHHVLQHHKGKRPVRIARTKDHEAFAAQFVARHRSLVKGGKAQR